MKPLVAVKFIGSWACIIGAISLLVLTLRFWRSCPSRSRSPRLRGSNHRKVFHHALDSHSIGPASAAADSTSAAAAACFWQLY